MMHEMVAVRHAEVINFGVWVLLKRQSRDVCYRGFLALLYAIIFIAGIHTARASEPAAQLRAQVTSARAQLGLQSGPVRVLLVAAGLDKSSLAFSGDVRLADKRLREWVPHLASLKLAQTGKGAWPLANRRTLPATFQAAADLLNQQSNERIAIVLLSSHGSEGYLALQTPGMRDLELVDGATLQRWLEPLGDTPTLLILSACHAGSLIPTLRGPHRIVLAAARSDRSSFGCESESQNTYFVDALFRSLRPDMSVTEWFSATVLAVAVREGRMGLEPPSDPQIDIGDALRDASRRPLKKLLGLR